MATDTTPIWTRQGTAIARTTISSGGLASVLVDFISYHEVQIFATIAKKAATGYGSNAPEFICRPMYSTGFRFPNNIWGCPGTITTPNKTTTSAGCSAGDATITLTSATGFAAGQLIAIGFGTSAYEIARISKVSGSTITLDAIILNTHSSGVDVSNYADSIYRRLRGGEVIELGFDYGNSSSGPDIEVACHYITYDKDHNA